MKKCNKCNIEKEFNEFIKRKNSKDGYINRCKSCTKKYNKKYRESNKEILSENKKKYYTDNKYSINNKNKLYHSENKNSISKQKKNYYNDNKEKIKERTKKYYYNNKEKINAYKRIYHKNRKSKDHLYKLSKNIKSSIRKYIKNKGYKKKSRTYEILGCNFNELLNNLNHNVYGFRYEDDVYDIDHIIPISSAKTEVDIYRLNHYTNLQLLPRYYNRYIKCNHNWVVDNFEKWLSNNNI